MFSIFVIQQGGANQRPLHKALHWVVLDFPPFLSVSADTDGNVDITKSSGPIADIQKELVKALPEYDHSYRIVSFMRAQKLFESHAQYCTILFFRTPEREKYLYFGEMMATTTPPGLIIDKTRKDLLKNSMVEGRVDLPKLLASDFRLGIVQGRSFSGEIDTMITKSEPSIFKLVLNQTVGRLFLMLRANRLDGVLAYYLEFKNEQERNPAAGSLQFVSIQLQNHTLELPVACEKSPWGKDMTKKISQISKTPALQKKIYILLKQTLPPEFEKEVESRLSPHQ